MAHGDYECCAVCDRKMAYASMAEAKTSICGDCVVALAKRQVFIPNPEALIAWVRDNETEHVRETLKAVGFQQCYYGSDVDDAVAAKLGDDFGAKP
jgi:hypothetical protein